MSKSKNSTNTGMYNMDFSPEFAKVHLSRPLYLAEAAIKLIESNRLGRNDDPFEFMRKLKTHPKIFPSRDASLQPGINGVWRCEHVSRSGSQPCGELNLPAFRNCRRCKNSLDPRGMAVVDEYVAILKRALFEPDLPLGVHVEAEARRTASLQMPKQPPIPLGMPPGRDLPMDRGVNFPPGVLPSKGIDPFSSSHRREVTFVPGGLPELAQRLDAVREMEAAGRFGIPLSRDASDASRFAREADGGRLSGMGGGFDAGRFGSVEESHMRSTQQENRFEDRSLGSDRDRGRSARGYDAPPGKLGDPSGNSGLSEEAAVPTRMRFDPIRGLVPVEAEPSSSSSQRQPPAPQSNKIKEMARQAYNQLIRGQSGQSAGGASAKNEPEDRGGKQRTSRFSDKDPVNSSSVEEAPIKRIRIDPFAGAVEVKARGAEESSINSGYSSVSQMEIPRSYHHEHQRSVPSYDDAPRAAVQAPIQTKYWNPAQAVQAPAPASQSSTISNWSSGQQDQMRTVDRVDAYNQPSRMADNLDYASAAVSYQPRYNPTQQSSSLDSQNRDLSAVNLSNPSTQEFQAQLALLNQKQQQYAEQSAAAQQQIQKMLLMQATVENAQAQRYLAQGGQGAAASTMSGMQNMGITGSTTGSDQQTRSELNMMYLAAQNQQQQRMSTQSSSLQTNASNMTGGSLTNMQLQSIQTHLAAGGKLSSLSPAQQQAFLTSSYGQAALASANAGNTVQQQQNAGPPPAAVVEKLELQYQQFKRSLQAPPQQQMSSQAAGTNLSSQDPRLLSQQQLQTQPSGSSQQAMSGAGSYSNYTSQYPAQQNRY